MYIKEAKELKAGDAVTIKIPDKDIELVKAKVDENVDSWSYASEISWNKGR